MNIGWMQTGFTAVFTCPFRFRTNQADTGTAGVKVNFKGMGKESINVAFGKEIRCAMRAVHHRNFPIMGEGGNLILR